MFDDKGNWIGAVWEDGTPRDTAREDLEMSMAPTYDSPLGRSAWPCVSARLMREPTTNAELEALEDRCLGGGPPL